MLVNPLAFSESLWVCKVLDQDQKTTNSERVPSNYYYVSFGRQKGIRNPADVGKTTIIVDQGSIIDELEILELSSLTSEKIALLCILPALSAMAGD